MSVAINPSSVLGFNRPLTEHVKRNLAITNNNNTPVAFKVKTTAPKLYCVRPNSGRVEPGETVDVQVMLQAMKDEPPLTAKCKDKFLIQSTYITPEKETLPLAEIWNTEGGEEIHSQKIRVAYLPAEGQPLPEEDETQPNISSMLLNESYATVRQAPQTNGHALEPILDFAPAEREAPVPIPAPEPVVPHEEEPLTPPAPPAPVLPPSEPEPEPEPAPPIVNVTVHPPPPSPPPAPVPLPIVPDPNEEILARLKEANTEIERLRNIISSMPDPSTVAPTTIEPSVAPTSESGFRRRRTRSVMSDDVSTLSPETEIGSYVDDGGYMQQQEGVPLQVVIIIALGVFVTTYLFF